MLAIVLLSCQSRWELPSPLGTALPCALRVTVLNIFSQVCQTSAKGVPFAMPGLFQALRRT